MIVAHEVKQVRVAETVLSFLSGFRRSSEAVLLAFTLSMANSSAADGDPFFSETLVGLDGTPAALARLRGRPLVVNFWARWCAPCRTEIPQLSAHRARFQARGVDLLGVAVEDKPEVVQAFVKAYEIDYPILVAGQRGLPMLKALGDSTAALPYTVVFDREGKSVFRKLGALSSEEMDSAFNAALIERTGDTR